MTSVRFLLIYFTIPLFCGFVKLDGRPTVESTLSLLSKNFVHVEGQNFILMINTGKDGTCKYCNYLEKYGMGDDYTTVMDQYGCAELTWDRKWGVAKQFGLEGETLPLVALFPNPKDERGNTNTWYAENRIINFAHGMFETKDNAKLFPATLEKYLKGYTNEIHFAEIVTNVVEDAKTNATVAAVVKNDVAVKVTCPTYVKEGGNAAFTFDINMLTPEEVVCIITCNSLFKTNFTTEAATHSTKTVYVPVDVNDDTFDIATTNVYKFIVGTMSATHPIPVEDILVKTRDCGITSADGMWFVDYDDRLQCKAYGTSTTGRYVPAKSGTMTIRESEGGSTSVYNGITYVGNPATNITFSCSSAFHVIVTVSDFAIFDVFIIK